MSEENEQRTDEIILEIKLPVPVKTLAALADALSKLHGPGVFMRQAGPLLQLVKPSPDERRGG